MKFNKYLKIGLHETKESIDIKESMDSNILQLLEMANKELGKYYSGKLKFTVSETDGVSPDNLRLTLKKKRQLKEKWLQFNSELSLLQRTFQKILIDKTP